MSRMIVSVGLEGWCEIQPRLYGQCVFVMLCWFVMILLMPVLSGIIRMTLIVSSSGQCVFFMLCWDHIFCSGLLVVTKVVMLLWEHQSYRIANQEFFSVSKGLCIIELHGLMIST